MEVVGRGWIYRGVVGSGRIRGVLGGQSAGSFVLVGISPGGDRVLHGPPHCGCGTYSNQGRPH